MLDGYTFTDAKMDMLDPVGNSRICYHATIPDSVADRQQTRRPP
jgi:hypothetical protein